MDTLAPGLREAAMSANPGDGIGSDPVLVVCGRREGGIEPGEEEMARAKWHLASTKLDAFQNRYFDRVRASANARKNM